jgi:hypothetical protein
MLATIGSPCVCVHSSIAKKIKWDGWKCGDYRYIIKAWDLSANKKWIKKSFVNIGSVNGNLGKRNDIMLSEGKTVTPIIKSAAKLSLKQQVLRAIEEKMGAKDIVHNPLMVNLPPINTSISIKTDDKYKNFTYLYDMNFTFNDILEKSKNGVNYSFIRFGDNDIMQCSGEAKGKILGNNKTKFSSLMQSELLKGMRMKNENFIKSYNLGISGYGKKVPLCAEAINIKFLKFIRKNDPVNKYHSPYIFYYYSIFYPEKMKEYLDVTIRSKKSLFFGGNEKHDMEKIFGKLYGYINVPKYSASDHIERYWKAFDEKITNDNDLQTIVFAAGQLGRILQIRTWEKYGDKYTLIDIGSIVDVYRKGNERKYMKIYKNRIKANIQI